MKALGLVVSEKKIFLYFHHDAPRGGARVDHRGTVGRIYKKKDYILLQTKYESWQDLYRGQLNIATHKI